MEDIVLPCKDNKRYASCMDCGDYFISEVLPKQFGYMCGSCQRSNFCEPWLDITTLYRALRSEEDPISVGLRPYDPDANLTVAEHVEHGSLWPSQYVSMTGSIAVAAFFAAKGYHEKNQLNCRIAALRIISQRGGFAGCDDEVDEELSLLKAATYVGGNWTARNYARAFDEYIFTEVKAGKMTNLEKIIQINNILFEEFIGNTTNFSDFEEQYNESKLKERLVHAISTDKLQVKLDVVGLQYYKTGRPHPISHVRLVLDDSNIHDPGNAIQVQGRSILAPDWVCVGYLMKKHAVVTRRILQHAEDEYIHLELPDFGHKYATTMKIEFRIEQNAVDELEDEVFNVGGESKACREWMIG